jgi:hypothetical protein
VGYDIDFVTSSTEEASISEEVIDELPPLDLTPTQRACWQRIVHRIQAEIGSAQTSAYTNHLELWLEQPAIQVWYAGDVVTVEMPYWYTDSQLQAITAIRVLYSLAGVVQEETGMEAHDPQIGVTVNIDHAERAARAYCGTGQTVLTVESRTDDSR